MSKGFLNSCLEVIGMEDDDDAGPGDSNKKNLITIVILAAIPYYLHLDYKID